MDPLQQLADVLSSAQAQGLDADAAVQALELFGQGIAQEKVDEIASDLWNRKQSVYEQYAAANPKAKNSDVWDQFHADIFGNIRHYLATETPLGELARLLFQIAGVRQQAWQLATVAASLYTPMPQPAPGS